MQHNCIELMSEVLIHVSSTSKHYVL